MTLEQSFPREPFRWPFSIESLLTSPNCRGIISNCINPVRVGLFKSQEGTVELVFQLILLIAGAIFTFAGFNADPDVVWAIVVGIILLVLGGVWLIVSLRGDDGDGGGFDFDW